MGGGDDVEKSGDMIDVEMKVKAGERRREERRCGWGCSECLERRMKGRVGWEYRKKGRDRGRVAQRMGGSDMLISRRGSLGSCFWDRCATQRELRGNTRRGGWGGRGKTLPGSIFLFRVSYTEMLLFFYSALFRQPQTAARARLFSQERACSFTTQCFLTRAHNNTRRENSSRTAPDLQPGGQEPPEEPHHLGADRVLAVVRRHDHRPRDGLRGVPLVHGGRLRAAEDLQPGRQARGVPGVCVCVCRRYIM